MKKPNGVFCSECQNYYWYAGACHAHEYNPFIDVDPMCPESIEDCMKFELKYKQERGFEHYDPLPRKETVEKCRAIYNTMCDDINRRREAQHV